jgi:hypothetical protein
MAWIKFEKIEFKDNLKSKAGTPYSAHVLTGIKKGYDGAPDEPYQKTLFENVPTTVIESGVERPGISIVSFFSKGCLPGDTVIIKNVRRAKGWEIASVENLRLSRGPAAKEYTPLTDDEKTAVVEEYADVTRPSTPQMAPLNYKPAVEEADVPF